MKNLDWTKLKAFADDKYIIAQTVDFERFENNVGKGKTDLSLVCPPSQCCQIFQIQTQQ